MSDLNVLYQFHFYLPFEYTHQLNPETNSPDGGAYPDPRILQYADDLVFAREIPTQPSVPDGDTDWTAYTGVMAQIADPKIVAANVFFNSGDNGGRVLFDNFNVNECDSGGV